MAFVARFEKPQTQLAVCRSVRGFWVALVLVNAAEAIHEAVVADWPWALLNGAVAVGIVGAYIGALGPMLADARRAVVRDRRAHIDDLERELGIW